MKITVQLFASLREQLGERVEIDVPEPATALGLLETFVTLYPQFKSAQGNLNVAVNQEYAAGDRPIPPGAEVAIFPPVSGGR